MREFARRALGGAAAVIIMGALVAPATASVPAGDGGSTGTAQRSDNHAGPLTARQEARRKAAQQLILSGQATPGEDGVLQLGPDKYYQTAVTGTGHVFTILSEFGDQGSGKLGRDPGPLHNA